MNIIYVRTYSTCTYIYIGTYLSSEGSKINFGPILGQKNWGKKIGIMSLAWQIDGGDTVADGSNRLAGIKSGQKILNDGLVCQSGDSCLPVVVAAYSSHLEITAGRNVQPHS